MPPGNGNVHLERLRAIESLGLPWYRSLYGSLRETIRPPRLPPLEVTSRPVAVQDIWGLYGRQKKSFVMSAGFQIALVAGLALAGLTNSRVPREAGKLIGLAIWDPLAEVPRVHPSAKRHGGGGGDRSILPASRGKLAPARLRQFKPPEAVMSNPDAKLTVNESIVLVDAPDTDPSIKNYGDPWAGNGPPSNGPGSGGGIGTGNEGGQGPGNGNGAGPGDGGPGFTGAVFMPGRSGLVNPVPFFKPEPDYSEDARKAKLQGTVVLELVVDQHGLPQMRKVLQSLGMGLDEQAIKAVSTWRFKAGRLDGKPVAVLVHVYVSFRLL